MSKVSITFYGGTETVTGANFILDVERDNLRIMIDCGLFQEGKYSSDSNSLAFPYDVSSIKYLFVTHAHADHIGRIPKLVKEGFQGKIFSTPETREISKIMFDDAFRIMKREAADVGKEPIYNEEDISKSFTNWQTIHYHEQVTVSPGIQVYAKDAGHILGSAIYEFTIGGKKIVFTGDLGNSPSPVIRDVEKVTDANFMVMESVYGDKNHEDRDLRLSKLRKVISETIQRKGVLIIPAFSIERSQAIIYEINNLVEDGKIEAIPVFLDSPLAIQVTDIYRKSNYLFNPGVKKEIDSGDNIFDFPKLKFTFGKRESERIERTKSPKIIIAGGGMSEGGRVLGHESKYLPDPESTILFVGYQAPGTLGRSLLSGEKEVYINGEKVKVRARIESISGYSSHMDSDHLLEFAANTKGTLEKVFLVMGERKASMFLAQRMRDYADIHAICPEKGKKYEIFSY